MQAWRLKPDQVLKHGTPSSPQLQMATSTVQPGHS